MAPKLDLYDGVIWVVQMVESVLRNSEGSATGGSGTLHTSRLSQVNISVVKCACIASAFVHIRPRHTVHSIMR